MGHTSGKWLGVAGGVAAMFVAGNASAQVQPPVSTPVAPTREEVDRGGTPRGVPQSPGGRARLSVEGDIERAPCALADPAYAGLRTTITGAEFNGLKYVSPEDLRPAYAAYLGQERPVSAICDIRDAAATILRRRGYLAAVQVPTQTIENGIVRFEVLFARLAAVRVRGDAGRAESVIAGYLNKLTGDEAFNRFQAERYLLLARDLPGYDVRLALRPTGERPGDLIGEVTVVRTPVEVDLNVQNFAGRDTGRFGAQLRGQFYGLTGLGDRTTIAAYSTTDFAEQQILQLGHDMRLGGEGLTLSGRFTYAWTDPALGPTIDVTARTLFATLEASYPFVRRQAANLRGAIGLDYLDQRVRFNGLPLTRDRLRVAFLRLDGDAVDARALGAGASLVEPRWRLGGSIELRRGLSILDASDRCSADLARCATVTPPSRLEGDPTATVLRATATGELRLARGISFALSPRAQYAARPLLAFEEYSAGSYTIGRGYDPGTLLGDSGIGFSAELRAGRLQPFAAAPFVAQPFLFVDSAWIWNEDAATRGDRQRLTSVGGGVRASFDDRVRLDLTLAVPTNRPGFATRRGDTRVLFSLTTRLAPWRTR